MRRFDVGREFLYNFACSDETFLGSSMVERSAVNRLVVGSSPARGVYVGEPFKGFAHFLLPPRPVLADTQCDFRLLGAEHLDGSRDFPHNGLHAKF